jgi:ABC-type transporter Mla subunit MlaD
MPETRVKTALSELHQALEDVDSVDPDLRDLLQQVDGDIHALLETQSPADEDTSDLMAKIEELGAEFAARHPHTERFFQELVSTLGRLGI